METAPSTNGHNGPQDRDESGRFLAGNRGGPGNPHAAAVGRWRAALVEAVSPDDLRAVIALLVTAAKGGAIWAVRELLDRCLGSPRVKVEIEAANSIPYVELVRRLREGPERSELYPAPAAPKALTDDAGPEARQGRQETVE
jgi:hypothetical protein